MTDSTLKSLVDGIITDNQEFIDCLKSITASHSEASKQLTKQLGTMLLNGETVPILVGNGFATTNPASIEHFVNGKKQYVNEHVAPHSLIMISVNHCDYTGYFDNIIGELSYVPIPYNNLYGIACRKEMVEHAINDVYDSCLSEHIYPVHDSTQTEMGFGEFISVKRSNGEIQHNWKIAAGRYTSSTDETSTLITVRCDENDTQKGVILEELCELNKVNYDVAKNVLVENLKKWYKKDN